MRSTLRRLSSCVPSLLRNCAIRTTARARAVRIRRVRDPSAAAHSRRACRLSAREVGMARFRGPAWCALSAIGFVLAAFCIQPTLRPRSRRAKSSLRNCPRRIFRRTKCRPVRTIFCRRRVSRTRLSRRTRVRRTRSRSARRPASRAISWKASTSRTRCMRSDCMRRHKADPNIPVCETCHGPGSAHAQQPNEKGLIIGYTKNSGTPIADADQDLPDLPRRRPARSLERIGASAQRACRAAIATTRWPSSRPKA